MTNRNQQPAEANGERKPAAAGGNQLHGDLTIIPSKRRFLKAAAIAGAGGLAAMLVPSTGRAQQPRAPGASAIPNRFRMAGYSPSTTSFSRGLTHIGDRLRAEAGLDVDYVYNVLEIGYGGGDLRWLVDAGVLGAGYVTMTDVPELELAALPFLFADHETARAAMDGPLGESATASLEATNNYRILGYFENGFRHISNNVRPVETLDDLRGLKIRVLGAQRRTFELLGAEAHAIDLTAGIEAIRAGELDGQENPFANIVTYNIYPYQRYYTTTYHSYLSRPIFVHRPTFDAWPADVQQVARAAAREAVALQRELHDEEEPQAQAVIGEAGGEILELSSEARTAFMDAVQPLYAEARSRYPAELLEMVGL